MECNYHKVLRSPQFVTLSAPKANQIVQNDSTAATILEQVFWDYTHATPCIQGILVCKCCNPRIYFYAILINGTLSILLRLVFLDSIPTRIKVSVENEKQLKESERRGWKYIYIPAFAIGGRCRAWFYGDSCNNSDGPLQPRLALQVYQHLRQTPMFVSPRSCLCLRGKSHCHPLQSSASTFFCMHNTMPLLNLHNLVDINKYALL